VVLNPDLFKISLDDVAIRQAGQASAVRAPRPTARPAHASAHLIDPDLNAMLPRFLLLRRCDPTDPLISGQRGNLGPKAPGRAIGFDSSPQIRRQLMDRAARDFVIDHILSVPVFLNAKLHRRVGKSHRKWHRPAPRVIPLSVAPTIWLSLLLPRIRARADRAASARLPGNSGRRLRATGPTGSRIRGCCRPRALTGRQESNRPRARP
jgi:hypothetical protein